MLDHVAGAHVCVAAGTSPNVIYEKEKPGTFKLDAKASSSSRTASSKNGDGEFHSSRRITRDGFFTSYEHDGKFITYYGDNHPQYAGNVVKAMASAKDGYPQVARLFARELAAARSGTAARSRCGVGAARRDARRGALARTSKTSSG